MPATTHAGVLTARPNGRQPGDPVDFDQGRSWSDGKWGGYNGQGHCGDSSWKAASSSHGCALTAAYASDPENLGSLPDNVTLATAQQFLKDAEADYAKSKRKFWLGVGFVKPHMPQVSLSLCLSLSLSVSLCLSLSVSLSLSLFLSLSRTLFLFLYCARVENGGVRRTIQVLLQKLVRLLGGVHLCLQLVRRLCLI